MTVHLTGVSVAWSMLTVMLCRTLRKATKWPILTTIVFEANFLLEPIKAGCLGRELAAMYERDGQRDVAMKMLEANWQQHWTESGGVLAASVDA